MLNGHLDSVYAIAFSPDGRQLVSASDSGTVRLWDTGTGAAIRTLEGHWSSNQAVAFSSDGKVLVSALGDGTVRLWDAGTRAVGNPGDGKRALASSRVSANVRYCSRERYCSTVACQSWNSLLRFP